MAVLGPQPPQIAIGFSDYRQLREGRSTYIDKTGFVGEVLDARSAALLYPRPRRFGKTLNLSTLRYFLEAGPDDLAPLFEDTAVWREGKHGGHFQRYPVIYLTFKDVKAQSWELATQDLIRQLQKEVRRLRGLYALGADTRDVAWLEEAEDGKSLTVFRGALERLSRLCREATGEPVVILVDEYDAPLHAAWQHGYWEDAVTFFRPFLSSGFKDNPDLFRGVMTGILRVAKEGIFSGLNNIDVRSILRPAEAVHFGFTEAEVEALAADCGHGGALADVRAWYDGYRFGGTDPKTVYNPWSVLQFFSQPKAGLLEFWKNSSSNELIRDLLVRHADAAGPELRRLIARESIERLVDDNVALPDLYTNVDVLWGLLTFAGYLSADRAEPVRGGFQAVLRIPNEEVLSVYEETFANLLTQSVGRDGVDRLFDGLLRGDARAVEADLEDALLALSSHDFGRRPIEAIYQAFLVGLLVHVQPTHRVISNREAGHGRADVLIVPREPGPGAVLELKVVGRRETPEEALERALDQLRDRDYAHEVTASGATTVHQFAVVFDGKRCWVASLDLAE